MSSSQRDVEREWREKQQVKESRSQSGQKGISSGDTSGNGPGTGILGVGWRRSRNPGMQGKDFVLPSRNSSFPSCIPNKNLDTAEARPHFSCSRQLPPFPNPHWAPLPISLRCKIPKTATWDGSPHSFGLFFGKKPGLGSSQPAPGALGLSNPAKGETQGVPDPGRSRARDEKWDFGTLVPINFLFREMQLRIQLIF